jgi:hypothetical protein
MKIDIEYEDGLWLASGGGSIGVVAGVDREVVRESTKRALCEIVDAFFDGREDELTEPEELGEAQ